MHAVLLIFVGILLGVLNSLALTWTAKQVVAHKNTMVVVPSLFLRLSVICIVFYIFLDNDWRNAVYMLVGLTAAKVMFITIARRRGFIK